MNVVPRLGGEPSRCDDGHDGAQKGLQRADKEHEVVDLLLEVTHLDGSLLGVLHNLGVHASVGADCDSPVGVLQLSSLE